MTALDGVYAKLDRARTHADGLRERIEIIRHPDLHEFVRERDAQSGEYVYRIQRLPFMDTELSLILGDFLTNVRASLDHLAHQLVIRDGGTPNKNTSFPILEKDVTEKGKPRTARIAQVTDPDVISAVEAVQPYSIAKRGGGSARRSPLWNLNHLVNIDKHRLLLVVAVALDVDRMYWVGKDGDPVADLRVNIAPLNDGDPVAWFDFHGAEPDEDFDPHLGIEICLQDGPRVPLMGLLGGIYQTVEHMIIGYQFAHFFGLGPRHGMRI